MFHKLKDLVLGAQHPSRKPDVAGRTCYPRLASTREAPGGLLTSEFSQLLSFRLETLSLIKRKTPNSVSDLYNKHTCTNKTHKSREQNSGSEGRGCRRGGRKGPVILGKQALEG